MCNSNRHLPRPLPETKRVVKAFEGSGVVQKRGAGPLSEICSRAPASPHTTKLNTKYFHDAAVGGDAPELENKIGWGSHDGADQAAAADDCPSLVQREILSSKQAHRGSVLAFMPPWRDPPRHKQTPPSRLSAVVDRVGDRMTALKLSPVCSSKTGFLHRTNASI